MSGVQKAIVWLLLLAAALSGCARQDMSQQDLNLQKMEQASQSAVQPLPQQQKIALRLPVGDSGNLNPFSNAGSRLSVTPLLYQSLYVLDDDYVPRGVLVSSMEVEGRACTITLQPGARFSDGTLITAQDVAASLWEALKYPSSFPALSRGVESCSAAEDKVVILLRQEDRNAAALLTFPICKSDSLANALPVGSGAFVPESSGTRMRRNPYYNSFKDSGQLQLPAEMETIELVPVADDESLEYMLKIGVIDLYFSADADSNLYSYGSTERLTLNRMTFLGFNRSGNSLLRSPGLVQVIQNALDKERMVSYAYGDLAQPVDYPFHPGYWERIQGDRLLEEERALEDSSSPLSSSAAEGGGPPTMEEAAGLLGYSQRDEEGFWVRESRGNVQRLSLRILVNAENEPRQQMALELAGILTELGIECQIVSEAYDTYLQSIAARRFDLYLGELEMEPNMDLSRFFSSENAPRLGFEYSAALEEAAIFLKTGQTGYKDFLSAFSDAAVMEPICYRKGCFSYSRNLPGDFISLHRELFLDIQNW